MKETILATVTRTFPAPKGYKGQFTITAQACKLSGNQHPHFSVTGDISTPAERKRGDGQAGGCLHEEALKVWPVIAPIVALHLSNADDGEPMHAEANGFYNLAGSVEGNFGEKYHRGTQKMNFPAIPPADKPWMNYEHRLPSHQECLAMLAEHLRCSVAECKTIRQNCVTAFQEAADKVAGSPDITEAARIERTKAGRLAAKAVFHKAVEAMRGRWQTEANAGLALIAKLAAK